MRNKREKTEKIKWKHTWLIYIKTLNNCVSVSMCVCTVNTFMRSNRNQLRTDQKINRTSKLTFLRNHNKFLLLHPITAPECIVPCFICISMHLINSMVFVFILCVLIIQFSRKNRLVLEIHWVSVSRVIISLFHFIRRLL